MCDSKGHSDHYIVTLNHLSKSTISSTGEAGLGGNSRKLWHLSRSGFQGKIFPIKFKLILVQYNNTLEDDFVIIKDRESVHLEKR